MFESIVDELKARLGNQFYLFLICAWFALNYDGILVILFSKPEDIQDTLKHVNEKYFNEARFWALTFLPILYALFAFIVANTVSYFFKWLQQGYEILFKKSLRIFVTHMIYTAEEYEALRQLAQENLDKYHSSESNRVASNNALITTREELEVLKKTHNELSVSSATYQAKIAEIQKQLDRTMLNMSFLAITVVDDKARARAKQVINDRNLPPTEVARISYDRLMVLASPNADVLVNLQQHLSEQPGMLVELKLADGLSTPHLVASNRATS